MTSAPVARAEVIQLALAGLSPQRIIETLGGRAPSRFTVLRWIGEEGPTALDPVRRWELARGRAAVLSKDLAVLLSDVEESQDPRHPFEHADRIAVLEATIAALAAEDEAARAYALAVDSCAREDAIAGDVDALRCDLSALRAELAEGLERLAKRDDGALRTALLSRIQEATDAHERLSKRRTIENRPSPWPVPIAANIFELLAALARGPIVPSNAARVASLSRELVRVRALGARP
jgi:hypothetical protein